MGSWGGGVGEEGEGMRGGDGGREGGQGMRNVCIFFALAIIKFLRKKE